jgi:hypothetical protein
MFGRVDPIDADARIRLATRPCRALTSALLQVVQGGQPLRHIALDLVDTRTFDGRLQLLEYVPTVLDGPPGVSDS